MNDGISKPNEEILKMDEEKQKEQDKLNEWQKYLLNIIDQMKPKYLQTSEFKTIQMNLSTAIKELNSLRIKNVTGDIIIEPKYKG